LKNSTVSWLKVGVFLLCLVPLVTVVLGAFSLLGFSLGANPVEEIIHHMGIWGLRFLLITLAITPLRTLTGWVWLLRFRRMFGLFAFFYICMHFLAYAGIDQRFGLSVIAKDIIKRPYITLGMTGLLLLIPLAITSTRGWMTRLGRRWQKLHRLVYVIAILGVWHFYWQVKLDIREPLIYIAILTVLLGFRLVVGWQKRRKRQLKLQQGNSDNGHTANA
jgi:sulfoxide reductase heme-binding subunit YedZ